MLVYVFILFYPFYLWINLLLYIKCIRCVWAEWNFFTSFRGRKPCFRFYISALRSVKGNVKETWCMDYGLSWRTHVYEVEYFLHQSNQVVGSVCTLKWREVSDMCEVKLLSIECLTCPVRMTIIFVPHVLHFQPFGRVKVVLWCSLGGLKKW